jgi:hypothetical protein
MYSICCYDDMIIIMRKENAEKMESIMFTNVQGYFYLFIIYLILLISHNDVGVNYYFVLKSQAKIIKLKNIG